MKKIAKQEKQQKNSKHVSTLLKKSGNSDIATTRNIRAKQYVLVIYRNLKRKQDK